MKLSFAWLTLIYSYSVEDVTREQRKRNSFSLSLYSTTPHNPKIKVDDLESYHRESILKEKPMQCEKRSKYKKQNTTVFENRPNIVNKPKQHSSQIKFINVGSFNGFDSFKDLPQKFPLLGKLTLLQVWNCLL